MIRIIIQNKIKNQNKIRNKNKEKNKEKIKEKIKVKIKEKKIIIITSTNKLMEIMKNRKMNITKKDFQKALKI